MANNIAELENWCFLRSLSLVLGFGLVTYGHLVINDLPIFGVYLLLCMIAVAIVFYQTADTHQLRKDRVASVGIAGSRIALQSALELGKELELLEKEYQKDVTRLEQKWL